MVIAIKIVGTAMNMSIILIITWSTLPPKKPATEPIITPKMKDRSMMHTPGKQGDSAAVYHSCKHVPAIEVGSKRMFPAGGLKGLGGVHGDRLVIIDVERR